MVLGMFRWPALIVRDAKSLAQFYTDVFEWERWYDETLDFDSRFHPVSQASASARSRANLIVLGEGDSSNWPQDVNSPSIAIMEYLNCDIGDVRDHGRKTLGRGDVAFMVLTENPDEIYARALSRGARGSTPPSDYTIKSSDGAVDLMFRSATFFDPEGNYVEATKKYYSPA